MTPSQRMLRLALSLGRSRMFSTRMLIMLPILLLFIPGMAWGVCRSKPPVADRTDTGNCD